MLQSAAAQSCPKMLRRLILFSVFILLVTSSVSSEPVYRVAYPNALGSDCKDDAKGSVACATIVTPDNKDNNGGNEVQKHNDKVTSQNELALEEARGKKGKKGYGKILFAMAGLMKASMLYLMIHAVAALAGKALIVAKVALAIATAVGLKKALEHNDKTSYEIVKHPHHSYVQTHSTSVDYDHHHGGYEGGHRRRKRRAR